MGIDFHFLQQSKPGCAVVDQDERHDFVRVAVAGMNTLAVLAKDTKDESRSKDKSQRDG
ncbi:MAG: hypothetical protein DSM106950_27075 [Stigonema ocellatum SAG 48.90 = DSM 106950]|nr:hypothetical protein [Stigonema ocellatum SAG 48.90 = DSM 106950]